MTKKEKQKSNENKDEMIKTDILNDLKIIKLYKPPVISNSSNTETINKKPIDKIEPKFKVGDWVVFVKSESTYQVEKIENYKYTLRHILKGSFCLPFSDEALIREWTIQDAKDGDMLACNEDILLFKSYSALQGNISLYCWYNGQTNNFFNNEMIYVSLNKRNKICPATKEQRDILYQKIKEEKNNNAYMNKNIDLTNILKDCPKGTKFYSSLWGKISFERIVEKEVYTIEINTTKGYRRLTKEGYYIPSDDAECIIFPSKDQKDWNKFTAPWYKENKLIKPRFKNNISMNKNIDLTKILKNCPKGTVFWSDDYGKVEFFCIDPSLQHPIKVIRADGISSSYTKEGQRNINFIASCLLWPSRDCRDWSKFTANWLKKERFDPKTLKPFDKVLVRDKECSIWKINMFSYIYNNTQYPYDCFLGSHKYCIPYNNDTKHLVGTTEEAPEYYKYWED